MKPVTRIFLTGVLAFGFLCAMPDNARADAISINLTAIIAGPPKQFKITVQDATEGIFSIEVTTSNNANTIVPAFVTGFTGPVVITATKIDQSKTFDIALKVTDVQGSVSLADFNDGPITNHVPEPGSLLLLCTGLLGMVGAARGKWLG